MSNAEEAPPSPNDSIPHGHTRTTRLLPLPRVSLVRFSRPPSNDGAGVVDSNPAARTPASNSGPSEWYIVTNPLERYVVTSRGDVRKRISSRAATTVTILAAVAGLLAGILTLVSSPDGDWTAGRAIVSVPTFAILVGLAGWLSLLAASTIGAIYRTSRDHPAAYLRVDQHDTLAWRLCRVTEAVIKTTAWRHGTVDPSRQVAIISWSAIGRALMATRRLDDARRATAHLSLAAMADEAIAALEQEMEALEQIYLNLGRVLLAAKSVDEQRIAAEQRRKDRLTQKREEAELRQKLTGSAPTVDLHDSLAEADRSAGVAAETNVVAQLLAQSEQLLRDVD